jgi:hypothetical protein
MTHSPSRDRWFKRIAPFVLSLSLLGSPQFSRPALAQEPAEAQGEGEKGRPLDGYLATTCLVLLAFFVVGRTARR